MWAYNIVLFVHFLGLITLFGAFALHVRAGMRLRAATSRDLAAMSAVSADIAHAGGKVTQAAADLTKFADIEAMRRQIEGEFGPIDVLVANAGGSFSKPGALEQTSEEEWHASVNGNLTATFLTIKSFLPGMKARKAGNIITMASAASRRPHPASPIPYGAAKAGIEILTQRPRRPSRSVRHPGELHRARNNPHRTQRTADTGRAEASAG